MFWDNFVDLCSKAGKSPNYVCKELGFSNASSTHWKNGKQPRQKTLNTIAEYFGVSVDRLLQSKTTAPEERPLSDIEKELLSLTSDMDEDERNAVLGYAARIISKHKKED